MTSERRIAITVGVLFLITHVTSVTARFLYGSVLAHPTTAGDDTAMIIGALLEVVLAMAVVGTAVALYPIARRQNEGVAMGYVGLRTLEAGAIIVGVIAVLTLTSVRASLLDTTGAGAVSATLVAFQDWSFIVGPGLICGVDTVLMAWIMYRSGLVPRIIAVLGLVGGPLVFAANVLKTFVPLDQIPLWVGLAVVPVFAWELSLALYLIIRGFRPEALARLAA